MRRLMLLLMLVAGICEAKEIENSFFSEISAGYGFSMLPESLGEVYENNTSIAFSMGYMINGFANYSSFVLFA